MIGIVCCLQQPQSQLQLGESAINEHTYQYFPVRVHCNYSNAHPYIEYTQAQATTISGTRSQPNAPHRTTIDHTRSGAQFLSLYKITLDFETTIREAKGLQRLSTTLQFSRRVKPRNYEIAAHATTVIERAME